MATSKILRPAQSLFDFSIKGSTTLTTGLPTGMSYQAGTINYALNGDRTIGKIYGRHHFNLTNGMSATMEKDLGIIVAAPSTAYYIDLPDMLSFTWSTVTGEINGVFQSNLKVDTNGHVIWRIINVVNNSGTACRLFCQLPACVYFFKDFGDV